MTDKNIVYLQKFIYSKDVRNQLQQINKARMSMPINVFEIAGMGTLEIKHSNVLAWLFGDNEHQLGYEILEKFLGKVISKDSENTEDDNLKRVRDYVYFPKHQRDIIIQRELSNIDLLIEDKANQVVIVVENKVWAYESDDQIETYEIATNEDIYPRKKRDSKGVVTNTSEHNGKVWDVFYIFLTPCGSSVKNKKAKELWLVAQYKNIYDIIEEIIKNTNRSLSNEVQIILESYNDLLVRRNIVSNDKLHALCVEIWEKNKEALDILIKNRPDNVKEISEIILHILIEKKILTKNKAKEVKKRQQTGRTYRFSTIRTEIFDCIFLLEFWKEGVYVGIVKSTPEIDEKLKKNKKNKSKTFYQDWGKYIEYTLNINLKKAVQEKMEPVIKEIIELEDIIVGVKEIGTVWVFGNSIYFKRNNITQSGGPLSIVTNISLGTYEQYQKHLEKKLLEQQGDYQVPIGIIKYSLELKKYIIYSNRQLFEDDKAKYLIIHELKIPFEDVNYIFDDNSDAYALDDLV